MFVFDKVGFKVWDYYLIRSLDYDFDICLDGEFMMEKDVSYVVSNVESVVSFNYDLSEFFGEVIFMEE